jgi:hypothetical protein
MALRRDPLMTNWRAARDAALAVFKQFRLGRRRHAARRGDDFSTLAVVKTGRGGPDRGARRYVQVVVKLVERMLERRVIADIRSNLDTIDPVPVRPHVGQVGVSMAARGSDPEKRCGRN